MALAKLVKVGGSYYKGFKLTVDAAPGNYVLDMTLTDKACAANCLSVTPDMYGAGDYFKVEHLDGDSVVKALLVENVYNVGKSVTQIFDFPALELLDAGHKVRLTYVSVAGTGMSVYTILERLTTKSGGV